MDYCKIDKIINIYSQDFEDYEEFTNKINNLLNENYIILNIGYDREPKTSFICSYTLGHINRNRQNTCDSEDFKISHHDIALQLASLYIQEHKEKYENEHNFEQMCKDFCRKYYAAMLIIEDENKLNIVSIK